MRIALIGYGKMGKTIETIALEQGHEISLRVGRDGFEIDQLKGADVAIEFSTPDTVVDNIKKCFEGQIPVVVGTTAWYKQYEEVVADCIQKDGAMLAATNFSIGVNLFWKIVEQAANLLNDHPSYDVSISEIHHLQKLDAPSGTAITTAEKILKELDRKKQWVHHEVGNAPSKESLHLNISSERIDGVPGTHIVHFKNEIDSIEISHTAHNRQGFAMGALKAAEWLTGKIGIYTMDDLLTVK